METKKDTWWSVRIGRSSSIDTLDAESVRKVDSEIHTDQNIKSLNLSESSEDNFTKYNEENGNERSEKSIPESVIKDYIKGVKFEDQKIYKHPYQYAEEVVNELILAGQEIMKKYNYFTSMKFRRSPNISWPNQGKFNIFSGLAHIDEYIRTWKLHPVWSYFLELKNIREGPFGTEYVYEAKFSCPRSQFPVPQATASVFFYVLITASKPCNSEIDVYFMVESMESKFYPGNIDFNQKWLDIVVDSKIHFFKQIRR